MSMIVATFAVGLLAFTAVTSAAQASTGLLHRCTNADVKVWYGSPAGVAAGSSFIPIEVSKVTQGQCYLSGWPGLSALNNGHQIGVPAAWDRSLVKSTVTLTYLQTAHTWFQLYNVGNYSTSQCRPKTANTLRVYLPGSTAPVDIPFDVTFCSTKLPSASVQAFARNAGIPGYR
jgi:hypothetical protein